MRSEPSNASRKRGKPHDAPRSEPAESAPKPAPASGILALQAGAGNAAVSRYLAARPMLQRLKVSGSTVAPDSLDAVTAESYLSAWAKRDEKSLLLTDITEDDVFALGKQANSAGTEGKAYLKAKEEAVAAETDLLDVLKTNGTAIEAIKKTMKTAREIKDNAVKGRAFVFNSRERAAVDRAAKADLVTLKKGWEKAYGELAAVAYKAGLPALDKETIADFKKLETIKGRARAERAPLDETLQTFAPEVSKIIPGATLGYRGSLARGVKSPTKFIEEEGEPTLASFDSVNVFKADRSTAFAKETKEKSFDCDANVEIPDKTFNTLGVAEGPLSKSKQDLPVIRQLVALEIKIDQAIKKDVKPKMPGLDTSSPFGLFLASASKASVQRETGTPYAPFMLENEFPDLAEHLPSAYSMELVNKLRDYYENQCMTNGLVYPVKYWEKYYATLYEHVKTEGPKAVFLPEVQIDVTNKRETTSMPNPRDGMIKGPYDVVAKEGRRWVGPATGWSDIVVGNVFEGEVYGNTRSYAQVDLGGDVECISFDAKHLSPGDTGIFKVDKAPRNDKEQWVVKLLRSE